MSNRYARIAAKLAQSTGKGSLRSQAVMPKAAPLFTNPFPSCPMYCGRPVSRWTFYGRWNEDGKLSTHG